MWALEDGGADVVPGGTRWPPDGFERRHVDVLGTHLASVEGGSGPTLVFLHGNPTSSFLWRHVLAELVPSARCVAVDLVGMGASGKPAIAYRYADQLRHVEAFLDALGCGPTVLVGHDRGAVLSLHLARARPDLVRAVAVCEGHLRPIRAWADMDDGSRALFARLRTTDEGRRAVLADGFFVEQVLPAGMHHRLTDTEWDAYRAPFPTAASRLPVLRWVEQIPVGGEPADVVAAVEANAAFLLHGTCPRLLLHGRPGSVVTADTVAWCLDESTGLDVFDVGPGTHFLPEDQPRGIARALGAWLRTSVHPTDPPPPGVLP